MTPIKCVIVGNSKVGKSSLLLTYINRTFTEPPRFSSGHYLTKATAADGSVVDLLICDTLGLKDYDRINRLSYPNTDVFLVCYSVEIPDDLYYVRLRWLPEIYKSCPPTVPIILVATKVDVRESEECQQQRPSSQTPLTYERGMEFAVEIGAMAYRECSALEGTGVSALFDAIATCGLFYRAKYRAHQRKQKCVLM